MLRRAIIAAIALVYLLGLNPYYEPATYDSVLYFFGAKSIASSGSFMYDGKYVVDWPPGWPIVLSIPMTFGVESIMLSKAMVVACAVLAMALVAVLFEREGRPAVTATIALFGLMPTSLILGTRVMSEWPFMLLSMAFLLTLDDLSKKRTLALALALGALLAMASLTRYIGALLGVPLVVEAAIQLRAARRVRAVVPECIAALVGGAPFVFWRIKLLLQIANGSAVARYHGDIGFLSHFEPRMVPTIIADMLFYTSRPASMLHLGAGALALATLPLFAVILVGAVALVRTGRGRPSDAYVAATLALLTFHEVKEARYVFPIAPFLLSYVFVGSQVIARRLRGTIDVLATRSAQVFLFAWIGAFAVLDGIFLFKGNGRSHSGISMLVTPSPERFYLGLWRELYVASQIVERDRAAEGVVGLLGSGEEKYVHAFSGHRCVEYPGEEPLGFAMAVMPAAFSDEEKAARGLVELGREGRVTVYRATRDVADGHP